MVYSFGVVMKYEMNSSSLISYGASQIYGLMIESVTLIILFLPFHTVMLLDTIYSKAYDINCPECVHIDGGLTVSM